ncbi:hypothetical protein Dda_5581 [Drechslerella dactyloides]|uniref:Uncharacterized protein n=1 Tax=Drechslerella dactyloides TaxID=74499 RepID=A0AAD6IX28_DREDA|nr:hypothetical protein Dda_5581 [Drechslerella dactyloides]
MIVVLCAACLIAGALSAVLPVRSGQDQYPARYDQYLWWSKENTTQEFVAATDNAWAKVDLKFPVKVFNKSSNTIWVSMNGIVSLDEPNLDAPSVPNRPLPIDPESFSRGGATGGFIPGTAIMPFWRDMSMKAATNDTGVWVQYTYHPGYEVPHYHIYWRGCDKAEEDWAAGREQCGKATRFFILTLGSDKPGVVQLLYGLGGGDKNIEATVGVQSYPDYISVPISKFYGETMPCAEMIIDTNNGNVTVNPFSFCI